MAYPIYRLIDPAGFFEHKRQLVEGLVYGVQNPKEFAKAVLDWETWKENPARALGHLVPDLVAAVFTAGGAMAATRGARAGRELEEAAAAARRAEEAAAAARRGGPPAPGAPVLTASQREAVDAYAAAAARTEPRITQALQDIQQAVPGARMEGLDFRLKTPDSLARKVAGDVAVVPAAPVERVLSRINDAVRYTYVADRGDYAQTATALMIVCTPEASSPSSHEEHLGAGRLSGHQQHLARPGHRPDLRGAAAHPGEPSTKERTHPLYEEQRLLPDDDPRWHELERQQQEIFHAIPRPDGAAAVGRREGASP